MIGMISWWVGRAQCRIGWHNDTCRGRTDHTIRNGRIARRRHK